MSRADEFQKCLLANKGPEEPPEKCLKLIGSSVSRWQSEDINEYGKASALAKWNVTSPYGASCDSLMDFMNKELAREVDPRDGRPPDNVFIYWIRFHEGKDLVSRNGISVPRGEKKRFWYVYLRSNYIQDKHNSWPKWRSKEYKYEALAHEMRHVMRDDQDHVGESNDVDTDGCTKRRVREEERANQDSTKVQVWGAVPIHCTERTRWDCIEITFDGIDDYPDHPDNNDPSGDSKQCGLIYLSDIGDAYFVCKGAPVRVCVPRTELRCNDGGGGLGRAACAVPDADARRPRPGIRAAE